MRRHRDIPAKREIRPAKRVLVNHGLMGLLITSLLTIFAATASACSLAGCLARGIEMRHDFKVKIRRSDGPLPGATVEIIGPQGATSRKDVAVLTDKDGIARIENLAPGDYWLNVEFLGITAAYECFHVKDKASRKAKQRLAFVWGDLAATTSHIKGKLVDSQPGKGGSPIWNLLHRTDVPIANARLKLQNAKTGAVYYKTSDVNGYFAFDEIPAGTYVLHVDAGKVPLDREYESTDQLIALRPDARRDSLVLKRREPGGGNCGGISLELQDTAN